MKNDKTIRSYGLKLITIAAVAILVFSMYSIFINDNEGESKALISVDEANQLKVVERGGSIIHNITVENILGARPIFVNLSAEIIDVSSPGVIGNWSVRFVWGGVEITNITVDTEDSEIVGVEVNASSTAILHEKATIRITAEDISAGLPGRMNTTRTFQNEEYGELLILETIRGQNYDPKIEIAPGTKSRLHVNPLTPTTFRVKVSNMGFKMVSIRLHANVGSPIRGETRASSSWKIVFSPSSLIPDLNSINEGVGYYTMVYINVTAPSNAIYGDYPITLTASSTSGHGEDSMQIKAVVPVPDLYATAEDITFSRFPVIDGQEMTINITIYNKGGALERSFRVEFWIEDTVKKDNYNIIGEAIIAPLGSHEETYAIVVLTPELDNKIKDTLTTTGIRINIDSMSEITESDEDNNQVDSNLEILQTPKATPGYATSLWMIVGMVAVGSMLAAAEKWKRNKRKNRD